MAFAGVAVAFEVVVLVVGFDEVFGDGGGLDDGAPGWSDELRGFAQGMGFAKGRRRSALFFAGSLAGVEDEVV